MSFWGCIVQPGQSKQVETRAGELLHLSQACIAPEAPTGSSSKVFVEQGTESFVVACLKEGQQEFCALDLFIDSKEAKFSVKGKAAVHLTGYFEADEMDEDLEVEGAESKSAKVKEPLAKGKVVETKPKAEPKVETKPKAEPKVEVKPKAEAKVEAKAKVKADAKAKALPKPSLEDEDEEEEEESEEESAEPPAKKAKAEAKPGAKVAAKGKVQVLCCANRRPNRLETSSSITMQNASFERVEHVFSIEAGALANGGIDQSIQIILFLLVTAWYTY